MILKYMDLFIFLIFVVLSVLCLAKKIHGSLLILINWCIVLGYSIFIKLPIDVEIYVYLIRNVSPIVEILCAVLTCLWLINLQKLRIKNNGNSI